MGKFFFAWGVWSNRPIFPFSIIHLPLLTSFFHSVDFVQFHVFFDPFLDSTPFLFFFLFAAYCLIAVGEF